MIIYLTENGGIYHYCIGSVKYGNRTRRNVYRSYYVQNNDNYKCPICYIVIPGLLLIVTKLYEEINDLGLIYYTAMYDSYIPKSRFKKYFNPKQIWSVVQE